MSDTSSFHWRFMLRAGLLAGLFTTYTAMIGMIVSFSERSIVSGVITLGQLLIYAPPLIAGYIVASRAHRRAGFLNRLLSGGITGFCTSLPTIALIIVGSLTDISNMFVNVTAELIAILTTGRGVVEGSLFLVGSLTILGLIGAGADLMPSRLRKAVLAGVIWVISIGLLSELVVQILRPFVGTDAIRTLFEKGALRPMPALVIFVVSSISSYLLTGSVSVLRHRYAESTVERQALIRQIGIGLLGIVLLMLPLIVGRYLSEVLDLIGLYVLMGLGLNIAVGLAGLLDLGYVTNFAVGAYVAALLVSTGPLGIAQTSFWVVVPVCILAAMCTGFLLALPVLRMRGDYLAITTLGFGEIVRILALSDWLKPYIGGAQGILFIPKPALFGFAFSDPQHLYYIIVAACLLMLFVSLRLNNSRTGRQWMAMREDEDAAGSTGIDTMRAKMLAFTLSAASGGLAGAIFAIKLGTIFPHSFNLQISINALSVIIVGGIGSIPGIVLGAFALIGLPELLREFAEYRLLLYGALLIIMMLVRPEGLWPSAARRRELHDVDAETVPAGD